MGRAAGAHFTHSGTAANYICLPDNPEYYNSTKKAIYAALVYGSEYETWGSPIANLGNYKVGFPTNTEEQQIENAKEQQSTNNGVVYTCWGSTECHKTATLVYFGRAAGAHYTHPGTAANYICLPHNPEYYGSTKKATYAAYVYGSEYETWGSPLHNPANHNVPCAVCYAERNAMIMVPAKITCPNQWTQEYNGYLMAAYYGHASPKTFVRVDIDAQPVRGEAHSSKGALFYHARLGSCYGLDCPPYDTKKDLACVVCTR